MMWLALVITPGTCPYSYCKKIQFRMMQQAVPRFSNSLLGVSISWWNTLSRVWYITYVTLHLQRGYNKAAQRYEFYLRVVKYCFLPRENKIHILFHRVIFFLLYRQEHFCTNNSVKARNDVIDILTSEDIENTPPQSQRQFCMNCTSCLFSTKTLLSIH